MGLIRVEKRDDVHLESSCIIIRENTIEYRIGDLWAHGWPPGGRWMAPEADAWPPRGPRAGPQGSADGPQGDHVSDHDLSKSDAFFRKLTLPEEDRRALFPWPTSTVSGLVQVGNVVDLVRYKFE